MVQTQLCHTQERVEKPEPGAPRDPAVTEPPPTMLSGYGGMSAADFNKPAGVGLSEHEAAVRCWGDKLTMKELVHVLKAATKHEHFAKFAANSHPRFGTLWH